MRDPYYAINAFYDALEKIDDYKSMRITEAAQKVQRSGFPEAYEDHAADARALASVLTGYSPGGQFTCVVHEPTERGSGDRVIRQVERAYGDLDIARTGSRQDVARRRSTRTRPAAASAGRSPSSSSPTASGCTPSAVAYDGKQLADRPRLRGRLDLRRRAATPRDGRASRWADAAAQTGQASRSAAAATRSSVAVKATRTWRSPARP